MLGRMKWMRSFLSLTPHQQQKEWRFSVAMYAQWRSIEDYQVAKFVVVVRKY